MRIRDTEMRCVVAKKINLGKAANQLKRGVQEIRELVI